MYISCKFFWYIKSIAHNFDFAKLAQICSYFPIGIVIIKGMWLIVDIIKIIGIGLIALIIIMIIKQYKPEFVVYVSLLAGAMILILIIQKIEPVIELLNNLSNKTSVNNEFLGLLIKITGIAFLTEYAVSVCKDAGETAIANKMDMGGKVIIVSMSVPIIASLLETVLKIMP